MDIPRIVFACLTVCDFSASEARLHLHNKEENGRVGIMLQI
jgi:hypothetical protein